MNSRATPRLMQVKWPCHWHRQAGRPRGSPTSPCVLSFIRLLRLRYGRGGQSRYLTHEGGAPGRAVGTRTVVDLCACASAAIAAPLLALQGASERTGGGMRVDKIAACNWHAISAAISMKSASMWEVRTRSQLARLGASASTARFQSPISNLGASEIPISNLQSRSKREYSEPRA